MKDIRKQHTLHGVLIDSYYEHCPIPHSILQTTNTLSAPGYLTAPVEFSEAYNYNLIRDRRLLVTGKCQTSGEYVNVKLSENLLK